MAGLGGGGEEEGHSELNEDVDRRRTRMDTLNDTLPVSRHEYSSSLRVHKEDENWNKSSRACRVPAFCLVSYYVISIHVHAWYCRTRDYTRTM